MTEIEEIFKFLDTPRTFKVKVLNKYHNLHDTNSVGIMRPSILGNPSFMKDKSDKERVRVVLEYLRHSRTEYKKKGDFYTEIQRLVQLYKSRGELELVCCCHPKLCHGDVLRYIIYKLVNRS